MHEKESLTEDFHVRKVTERRPTQESYFNNLELGPQGSLTKIQNEDLMSQSLNFSSEHLKKSIV